MSTQSIFSVDKYTLFQEYEDKLLCDADALYVNNHFLVGEGVSIDKINFNMNMHRLLCTDSCEMTNFINDKIAGKLDCRGEKLCGIFQNYREKSKKFTCSDTDIISSHCSISNIGEQAW